MKSILFEWGAGYYARKLASGPEAELRRDFVDFLTAGKNPCCPTGARVIDVGCGPGHVVRLLAWRGCRATGADRSRRLLTIARGLARRERVDAEFVRASADFLPFHAGAFDCAIATAVLYFVDRLQGVLAEMARVTRLGGTIATLDPHASMRVEAMEKFARRQHWPARESRKLVAWAMAAELNRRFEERELRKLFAEAGLTELEFERRLGGMVWFGRGVVAARLGQTETR